MIDDRSLEGQNLGAESGRGEEGQQPGELLASRVCLMRMFLS